MLKTKTTKTSIALLIIASCLIATPRSFAQQNEEPKSKMIQFHMALLRKGPRWDATNEQERAPILQQHILSVVSLLDSGKAAITGPLVDDTDLAGIFILRASSAPEAKDWVDNDPAVKAGLFSAEIHPWWSEDVFKKADSPVKLDTVYLGFLKKGPNRKDGDDQIPEVQELQKAHLANINRMAGMKKLIVAGPFGDDGVLRGVFVFRVRSLKEAQELCATDPMVKIGRLVIELHPWQVPEGVLP
jgi:uncharacterized protein YciI